MDSGGVIVAYKCCKHAGCGLVCNVGVMCLSIVVYSTSSMSPMCILLLPFSSMMASAMGLAAKYSLALAVSVK